MDITLVEKEVAEEGYTFTHLGASKICDKCNLKKVCVDVLQINHAYRIVEVKDKEHTCLIENQPMLVCAVEEADYKISVDNQKYLENVVLNRTSKACSEVLCENYDYCMPPIFNDPTKVKVLEIIKPINCPLAYNLVLVKARKVEQ